MGPSRYHFVVAGLVFFGPWDVLASLLARSEIEWDAMEFEGIAL